MPLLVPHLEEDAVVGRGPPAPRLALLRPRQREQRVGATLLQRRWLCSGRSRCQSPKPLASTRPCRRFLHSPEKRLCTLRSLYCFTSLRNRLSRFIGNPLAELENVKIVVAGFGLWGAPRGAARERAQARGRRRRGSGRLPLRRLRQRSESSALVCPSRRKVSAEGCCGPSTRCPRRASVPYDREDASFPRVDCLVLHDVADARNKQGVLALPSFDNVIRDEVVLERQLNPQQALAIRWFHTLSRFARFREFACRRFWDREQSLSSPRCFPSSSWGWKIHSSRPFFLRSVVFFRRACGDLSRRLVVRCGEVDRARLPLPPSLLQPLLRRHFFHDDALARRGGLVHHGLESPPRFSSFLGATRSFCQPYSS